MSNLPSDPISDDGIVQAVHSCVQEINYKKFSDKICHICSVRAKTPLETQKKVVATIKQIIKSDAKETPAKNKFYALKLLNKVVLKKNKALNTYVEQKILDRLVKYALVNNDPNEKSAQELLSRGKNIFAGEKDEQSSANFLIILLDCLEKWALTHLED